jgi:hypothetical protein
MGSYSGLCVLYVRLCVHVNFWRRGHLLGGADGISERDGVLSLNLLYTHRVRGVPGHGRGPGTRSPFRS